MDQPKKPAERRKPVEPGNSASNQRQRLRYVELLLEVTRRMSCFATLDEVLQSLVEMTSTGNTAKRGSLFLNDQTWIAVTESHG